jgi:hypothetical protein
MSAMRRGSSVSAGFSSTSCSTSWSVTSGYSFRVADHEVLQLVEENPALTVEPRRIADLLN